MGTLSAKTATISAGVQSAFQSDAMQRAMLPRGTAINLDPNTDPDGYFNVDTGLTMSTAAGDYVPAIPIKSIVVKGGDAGQSAVAVKVQGTNGSVFTWPISSIAANECWIIDMECAGIYKTGTTAVLVFPLFQ